MPAAFMTRKCLVIACRVMPKRSVTGAIELDPCRHKRATIRSRVSWPSAAKTAADVADRGMAAAVALRAGKVLLDERHDDRPAGLVGGERLGAALQRNAIEAGLGHGQLRAAGNVLDLEDDERRRLGGVVDALLDGEWMPSEREQPFGLDAIDGDIERDPRMLALRRRDVRVDAGADQDASHRGARRERRVVLHVELL